MGCTGKAANTADSNIIATVGKLTALRRNLRETVFFVQTVRVAQFIRTMTDDAKALGRKE